MLTRKSQATCPDQHQIVSKGFFQFFEVIFLIGKTN